MILFTLETLTLSKPLVGYLNKEIASMVPTPL